MCFQDILISNYVRICGQPGVHILKRLPFNSSMTWLALKWVFSLNPNPLTYPVLLSYLTTTLPGITEKKTKLFLLSVEILRLGLNLIDSTVIEQSNHLTWQFPSAIDRPGKDKVTKWMWYELVFKQHGYRLKIIYR